MTAGADEPAADAPSLEVLARDLERLERVTTQWGTEQRAAVEAIKQTVEQLHKQALIRLIRALKDDPAARAALVRAVDDDWVRTILTYHGLLRAPAAAGVRARLDAALAKVRPTLTAHGGDVEVAALEPPTVALRLVGTCDGCAFAGTTSRELIQVEVQRACPELATVQFVTAGAGAGGLVPLGKRPRAALEVCAIGEVPERAALFRQVGGASLLLTRVGDDVRAYPNACPHLGMPLDDAEIKDGVLTCRYHGFQYLLATGESLTVADVALPSLPVELDAGRVRVDVGRAALRGAP